MKNAEWAIKTLETIHKQKPELTFEEVIKTYRQLNVKSMKTGKSIEWLLKNHSQDAREAL